MTGGPAVDHPAADRPGVDRPADRTTDRPTVNRRMLEALTCPLTEGPLHYDADRSELVSKSARLAFPIRDGIPIMLMSEARRLD